MHLQQCVSVRISRIKQSLIHSQSANVDKSVNKANRANLPTHTAVSVCFRETRERSNEMPIKRNRSQNQTCKIHSTVSGPMFKDTGDRTLTPEPQSSVDRGSGSAHSLKHHF